MCHQYIPQRGARFVKSRKRSLRVHVNPNVPIAFSDESTSAHYGLEIFGRFVAAIDLRDRAKSPLRDRAGDCESLGFLGCLMGLLLLGGRHITHLRVVDRVSVFLRFLGLHRPPADLTVVRWMKRVFFPVLKRPETVIRGLVNDTIVWANLQRLTVDVDATVLRTGLWVEGVVFVD
jgi:hypothetical protein